MHALIDSELQDCDGMPDEAPAVQAETQPAAAVKDFGFPTESEKVTTATAEGGFLGNL